MSQLTTESTLTLEAPQVGVKVEQAVACAREGYKSVSKAAAVRQFVAGFLIAGGVAALALPTAMDLAGDLGAAVFSKLNQSNVAALSTPAPEFAAVLEKLAAEEAALAQTGEGNK
jgi:hypothetical protein